VCGKRPATNHRPQTFVVADNAQVDRFFPKAEAESK
jgi:hypothetical protein